MFGRSICWLPCILVAVVLATAYSDPASNKGSAEDLGALLDAGEGAVVTLVAGDTRLVAHRAVLVARSPVLAAMLRHYSLVTNSAEVSVPDVEGPVLRQLVAYLYTLQVPQLPAMAPQLLAAADKYGVPDLRAELERQVSAQLSVETAATTAVLAIQHSFDSLRDAAVNFIKGRFIEVLATKAWADAVANQPEEVVELSRLLAERLAQTSAPATTEARPTPTTQRQTALTVAPPAPASTTSRHSYRHQAALTTAPPMASRSSTPSAGAAVSHQPNLSEDKSRRLIEAAEEGAVDELQSLLAAGADVAAKDEGGSTALHWAAYRGHVEAVRRLLDAGAPVNATDNWQNTPLHLAAWKGHAAVVRLLTASAADLNAREKNGRTPLHLAVLREHTKVATALLEAGANREIKDTDGNTPLDVARQINRQQLIDVLSSPATADMGTTATTQPPSQPPTTVATPAIACPTAPLNEATVSQLRRLSGAEKNKRLREAAWGGRVAELRALLAAGADVRAKDEYGWTALDWATNGPAEEVKCLLDAGADVSTRDGSQYTSLHWAVRYGHADVVQLLAASSPVLNARDKWGYTPLHWAAWQGLTKVATVLLEAGADKTVRDNQGSTPLDVARSRQHHQVVAILT